MTHLRLVPAVLAFALCVPAAAGAQSAPPPVPVTSATATPQIVTTPSDLAPLAYLIGKWSCKTTAASGTNAGMVGRPFTVTFARLFDGTWIEGTFHFTSKKTGKTVSYERYSFGYDAFIKKWVLMLAAQGGGYDLRFADAVASVTVYRESAATAGGLSLNTFTVAKLGPGTFEFRYSGPIDQQDTKGSVTDRCVKS